MNTGPTYRPASAQNGRTRRPTQPTDTMHLAANAAVHPVRPGHVLLVDAAASVQFAGTRSLIFRVTRVCEKPTYQGWVWLTGYVIDKRGNATEKREIFVQLSGLKSAPASPASGSVLRAPGPARNVRSHAFRDNR